MSTALKRANGQRADDSPAAKRQADEAVAPAAAPAPAESPAPAASPPTSAEPPAPAPAEPAPAAPTLQEIVAAAMGPPIDRERLAVFDEADGSITFVYSNSLAKDKTPWAQKKLDELGVANCTNKYGILFIGPFKLRPRTDPRGCFPALLIKAIACCSALPGEEPRVSVFEPEWLWGSMLDIKEDGMDYDEERDLPIYRWSAAAMRTINDAITTLDGLRDPRQRGRPGFAGCGRLDGTPGTFPVGDKGHKGAAALDLTEPLLPRDPVDDSTYQPGAAVTLVGLTTASLNGATGWVAKALDGATGRIAVRLKPLSTVRVVLVKPLNLERDWDPISDGKEY